MKRNIYYKIIFTCLIILLISSSISAIILQSNYENNQIENLKVLVSCAINSQNNLDATYLSSITNDNRITIVELDGDVISDSQVDYLLMNNHSDRYEIASAISNGFGVSKRKSDTTDINMVYVAIKSNDYIYRISMPIENLEYSFLKQIPAFVIASVFALCVAFIISKSVVNSFVSPIEDINNTLVKIKNGDYNNKISESKYEEIESIINSINQVVNQIGNLICEIESKNDKLDYIIDNIGQGLILVDDKNKIVHCNKYALEVFSATNSLKEKPVIFLFHEKEFNENIEKCKETNQNYYMEYKSNGEIYKIYFYSISTTWQNNGVMILITNITQQKISQQIRKEFVSNVSHELKTPITSIYGFAQLLQLNNKASDEQKKEYINKIAESASDMQVLIDDILALSILDESKNITKKVTTNCYIQIKNIQNHISGLLESKQIDFSVNCLEDVTINMEEKHFRTMISELITNAIKYNKQNGKIKIDISKSNNNTIIKVKDTGVGIEKDSMPRVFERFFREDKSRNSSGSGLGLSIVKHIVELYNGDIKIKSEKNIGTTFVITI